MFDYRISHAYIIDGTGKAGYFADVAIEKGKIAAIGQLQAAESAVEIPAAGRILSPGLIDIHRHGDCALFRPDYGKAELYQGLTTVLNGNCGWSLAPITGPYSADVEHYLEPITGPIPAGHQFPLLASYIRQANDIGVPLHTGMLIGMGTLRATVAGFSTGDLDDMQLHQLHQLLETALCDGALGVSLGLGYAPECFYSTAGLIRALAPLRGSKIPVAVHMRQEGDGVEKALEEMLTVARALDLRLEVSHLKAIGKRNWRKSVPRMLEKIRHAREEGVDVACDVYPYPAGSTQLIHVLPPEIQEGGAAAVTAALQNASVRQRMIQRMETGTDFENIVHLVGFEHVRATGLKRFPQWEGKSILEIAEEWEKDPYTALFDLLVEENCGVSMIDFIADEADIDAILQEDYSGIISDATYPLEGLCHPRVYGTFPRLLETYVRKRHVLTLEQAIHKLTEQPAQRFGLHNKGRIKVGADADLCLFALENIHETGSWQDPAQLAEGMDMVFVEGRPVIEGGTFHSDVHGKLLLA